MRPIEHLIVALLLAVCYLLIAERRFPSLKLGAVAFVGSQFPDIVDKPLALELGLLPTGRVGMHSLPLAVPVWILVVAYAWKTDRPHGGVIFVIAHASHLVTDNRGILSTGRIPSDLLWPFQSPIARPPIPHWAGPNSINVHLFTLFSVGVVLVTTYYVVLDVQQHVRSGV